MIFALTFTLGACEKKEAKKPAEVKPPEASGIISNRVPPAVAALATGLLSDFGKDKIIQKAVKEQNAEGQTKAQIQEMDKKWQAAKKEGKTEPFMQSLMDNTCAKQLKKLMAENPFITEIFVTDNQGANVCQTGLTGDYWQGDEAKFKEVFKKGILVSHPEVEDGINLTQVSVPVTMGKRHIGTMTIGVNIDKVPGVESPAAQKAEEVQKPEPAVDQKAAAPQVAPEPEKAPESVAVKPEAQDVKAVPEAAEPTQEVTEKAVEAGKKEEAVEEKAEPSKETAPEKEAVVVAQAEAVEAPKEVAETKEEPPSELVEEAKESATKVTEQVEALEVSAKKAGKEIETLPAQVEKIQQEAEEVQREVESVAAQVKMVSEKVEKVSNDSQQVLDKARSAMEQVLKARAQLRDAADRIQKAAALMTEKLAEMESLSTPKPVSELPPAKGE